MLVSRLGLFIPLIISNTFNSLINVAYITTQDNKKILVYVRATAYTGYISVGDDGYNEINCLAHHYTLNYIRAHQRKPKILVRTSSGTRHG